MSNIPRSRDDLLRLIEQHFSKFKTQLDNVEDHLVHEHCDEDFTIKDILAIRLWWTQAVMRWIREGLNGQTPVIPAEGYSLQKMHPLHLKIAADTKKSAYHTLYADMLEGQKQLLQLVESLDDAQLTQTGVFAWTGKWPLMRWISVATSSQYDSGSKLIRKTLRSV